MDKPALLLINLGTPTRPETREVRTYLHEFLSDPRVIDLPAWRRWLLLHLIILRFRPRRSAEAYRKIWTSEGSPLLWISRRFQEKLQARLGDGVHVALAMRYGRPSIPEVLDELYRRGCRRIVVFPLYPQYSSAATGSSLEKVYRHACRYQNVPFFQVIPPFYHHPAFLDAYARRARPVLDEVRPERVFISFHGLPERQIRKADRVGGHCLAREDCCDADTERNADCYRAQCFATARALASRLGLDRDQGVVCFQSRLGREPWIRPYTDEEIVRAAEAGVRRAVILSPAFVADCLETLEELGMRAREDFQAHGGETLALVPALNDDDAWVDAAARIARESSSWLAPRRTCGEPAPAAAAIRPGSA